MTAPVLARKKFYIIKPGGGVNQIKNPLFDPPDGKEDWATSGAGVTIEDSSAEQRFGAYSMKVNTATGVASGAYYAGLTVTSGDDYTFSCDVKGVSGQAMRVYIADVAGTVKATTTFTATGYWQRVEVTHTSAESVATYRAYVIRDAVASTDPFYVDGAQFETAGAATTLMSGYTKGCKWAGNPRNSNSYRDPNSADYASGGWIVDLEDYCHVVQAAGLGHGDWNQIMTKMTSGGDMYQTHIRKSRQFSIVVDFIGDTLGEIEGNRKAVLDLIRPDLAEGQERIIRYQGVDVNGVEATHPVDIVCVPLSASMVDTPDLPTYQRTILNFAIPSGLLQGAYNEGKVLDLYADFPAEYIVKRDPNGNWCEFNSGTGNYDSLITGLNGQVSCMAEGPDGKIYVGGAFTDAGGTTDADYLARWNPVTEAWEAVVAGISASVYAMAFDANGDLYIGGSFENLGTADGDKIVKITDLNGTPTVNAMGTGANGTISTIAIAPNGDVYVGGSFTLAGGVANTAKIAKWHFDSGYTWAPLSTGLNDTVSALAFAPNGDLYIGGAFTNADGTYGDYLCYWDGSAFNRVGTVELTASGYVYALAFDATGWLYVGGNFTKAGGVDNTVHIAKWNGSTWEALGSGVDGYVFEVVVYSGKLYITGFFTSSGELMFSDNVAIWSNGAWQPLDIDLPGNTITYSILPASDGSLYIGGAFSTVGEDPDENAKTGVVALNLNVTSASANTYPFIKVNGPGTLKSITNYTTGKSVMFDGLTLNAGEWINLIFDPLDLQFKGGWDGRGNLMRYVIPGSDYGDFYLRPGANNLSLFMDDTTSATKASIVWTPKFWGLDGALL